LHVTRVERPLLVNGSRRQYPSIPAGSMPAGDVPPVVTGRSLRCHTLDDERQIAVMRIRGLSAALAVVCMLVPRVGLAWLTPLEPGASSGNDTGRAAGRALNGDLFVGGTLALVGGTGGVSAARLAAADGAVLWKETYRTVGGIFGQTEALAVDAAGDVVTAGWKYRAGNSFFEIAVVKRNSATGAELWLSKPNALCSNFVAAAFSPELARAVAIDTAGDVFITGNSTTCNASRGYDLVVVKRSGADGSVLWRKEINGTLTSGVADIGYAIDDRARRHVRRQACWKQLGSATSPKGYKYKDSDGDGLPHDLDQLTLKAGLAGRAKMTRTLVTDYPGVTPIACLE
jgi:hypothetical protein